MLEIFFFGQSNTDDTDQHLAALFLPQRSRGDHLGRSTRGNVARERGREGQDQRGHYYGHRIVGADAIQKAGEAGQPSLRMQRECIARATFAG